MADTKKGAERQAEEWMRANCETLATNSTVTVAKVVDDLVRAFELSVASGARQHNSLDLYRLILKKVEADMIGELPVSKLTTAHVDRMTTRMLTGTGHWPKTSTSLREAGPKRAFRLDAIKAGYLASNPVIGSRQLNRRQSHSGRHRARR
jgi:hypothetical protein